MWVLTLAWGFTDLYTPAFLNTEKNQCEQKSRLNRRISQSKQAMYGTWTIYQSRELSNKHCIDK